MFPLGQVPQHIGAHIMAQLYRALPPLPAAATPETREAREVIAMASIARLCPVNTAEARLAVQAVAAQAHATDCLEAVSEHYDDFRKVVQCRAQSALMMRQSAQALRELRELQDCRLGALARKLAEIEAERRRAEDEAEDRQAEDAASDRSVPTSAGPVSPERSGPAPVQPDSAQTSPIMTDPTTAAPAMAEPTAPGDAVEPDPRRLASGRPNPVQTRIVGRQEDSSHTEIQNRHQRNHETDSGLRPVPQRPRPSNAALIAALLPGTVRAGAGTVV